MLPQLARCSCMPSALLAYMHQPVRAGSSCKTMNLSESAWHDAAWLPHRRLAQTGPLLNPSFEDPGEKEPDYTRFACLTNHGRKGLLVRAPCCMHDASFEMSSSACHSVGMRAAPAPAPSATPHAVREGVPSPEQALDMNAGHVIAIFWRNRIGGSHALLMARCGRLPMHRPSRRCSRGLWEARQITRPC